MLSRNSPTFSGKKLVAPQNVTLLLVIDERRLTALIHSFVTTAISKYCFLQQFFFGPKDFAKYHILHTHKGILSTFFCEIEKKEKNSKIPITTLWERCDMKEGNDIEDNAIGWYSLVSMIRHLSL